MKKTIVSLLVPLILLSFLSCADPLLRDDEGSESETKSESESEVTQDDNVCGDSPAQLDFSSAAIMTEFVRLLDEEKDRMAEDLYFRFMGGIWPEHYSGEELFTMWNTIKDVSLPYFAGMNDNDYDIIYFPEDRIVSVVYIFDGLRMEFRVFLDKTEADAIPLDDPDYEYVCDITVMDSSVRIYDTKTVAAKAILRGSTVIDNRLVTVILRTSNISNVTEYVPPINEVKTLGELVAEYQNLADLSDDPEIQFPYMPDLAKFAENRELEEEDFYAVVLERCTKPGAEWPFFTKTEFLRMWDSSSTLMIPYIEDANYSYASLEYDIREESSDVLRFVYYDAAWITVSVYVDAASLDETNIEVTELLGKEYVGSLDIGDRKMKFYDVSENSDRILYCGVAEWERPVKIEIAPDFLEFGNINDVGHLRRRFEMIKFYDLAELCKDND